MRGQLNLFFGDEFEDHFLGKERANQAVHVLVGTTLPGGIRMGKEEVCPQLGSNSLMLGELTPVVCRERVNGH